MYAVYSVQCTVFFLEYGNLYTVQTFKYANAKWMNKYLARLRYRQHFNFFLYQENKVMLIIAFRHQILAFRYKIVEFCCAFGGGVHCTIITILNRNKVCRKLNWIFGHGTCNPDKGLISSEKFSWKSTFATMAHCQTKMISHRMQFELSSLPAHPDQSSQSV